MKLTNIYQNILILKYGFSILILGKVDIKAKPITRKEEGHFNIMKLLHQKFIEFLHEYVPN